MEQSVGGAGQFARIKEGEDHAGHEGERSRSPGRNDGARRNGRLEVEGVGLPHSDVDGGLARASDSFGCVRRPSSTAFERLS